MKKLALEALENRHMLTVALVAHDILVGDVDVFNPQALHTADMDGDGRIDLLSASTNLNDFEDGSVAWYRNIGKASFERQRIVASDPAIAINAADIDGDGDLDIVATIASEIVGVVWYENLGGVGEFADPVLLDDAIVRAIVVSDVDGDGDDDVILGSDRRLRWLENQGESSFEEHILPEAVGSRHVRVADLNGDMTLEIVAVLRDGRLVSYSQVEESGFGTPTVLYTGAPAGGRLYGLAVGDFDQDADVDITFAHREPTGTTLTHLQNSSEGFSASHARPGLAIDSLLEADVDLDGDLDLVGFGPDGSHWFPNVDGTLQTSPSRFFALQDATIGATGQLDSEGGAELLLAGSSPAFLGSVSNPFPGFRAFIALVRPGESGVREQYAIATQSDGANSLSSADIDGDGDLDLMASSFGNGRIAWYENLDGMGTFGEQRLVLSDNRPRSVQLADLDGDTTPDLLLASDSGVQWFTNNGEGTFSLAQRLTNIHANYAELADFDKDGDLDVLATTREVTISEGESEALETTRIEIFRNDGDGLFVDPLPVVTHSCLRNCPSNGVVPSDLPSHFIDLDGDGDFDVVQQLFNGLAWYRNSGSSFEFAGAANSGSVFDGFSDPFAFDTDQDGVAEIVTSDLHAFRYNVETDSVEGFQLVDFFESNSASYFERVLASVPEDFDNDGDLDLVTLVRRTQTTLGSNFESETFIALLERKGSAWEPPIVLGNAPFGSDFDSSGIPILAADFDADEDMDIAFGWTRHFRPGVGFEGPYGGIAWGENRLEGDANDDGAVDFADFLALSASFGRNDAVWKDGDFNADNVVDFSDFLLLSQRFGDSRG